MQRQVSDGMSVPPLLGAATRSSGLGPPRFSEASGGRASTFSQGFGGGFGSQRASGAKLSVFSSSGMMNAPSARSHRASHRASHVGRGNHSCRSALSAMSEYSRVSYQSEATMQSGFSPEDSMHEQLEKMKIKSASKKKSNAMLFFFFKCLEVAVVVFIVLDFLMLMYVQQSKTLEGCTWTEIDVCEDQRILLLSISLLGFFVLEALLQVMKNGYGLFATIDLLWDIFLTMVSVVTTLVFGPASGLAALPRMLRIFRLTHLGRKVRCLRWMFLLVGTITHSVGILLMGFLMFLINLILFSILAMEVVQVKTADFVGKPFSEGTVVACQEAFSSLYTSMETMFALAIGDRWQEIAHPIISVHPWAMIFFVVFVFFTFMAILATVGATLVENHRSYKADLVWVDEAKRIQNKQNAMARLQELFNDIDADGNGTITWQEFYHHREHNNEFMRLMTMFDLDANELDNVWEVLDANGDGEVSLEEFSELMWRLQSDETKWTLLRNTYITSQVYSRVDNCQKQLYTLESGLSDIMDSTNTLVENQGSMLKKWQELESNVIKMSSATASKNLSTSTQSAPLKPQKAKPRSDESTASVESCDETESATDEQELGSAPKINFGREATVHEKVTKAMSKESKGGLQTPGEKAGKKAPSRKGSKESIADSSEVDQLEFGPSMSDRSNGTIWSEACQSKRSLQSMQPEVDKILSTTVGGFIPEQVISKYMKGIPADAVACFNDQEVQDFWGNTSVTQAHKSVACETCDYFISHSWSAPADWNKYFKRTNRLETYEYKKAVELNSVLNARKGKGPQLSGRTSVAAEMVKVRSGHEINLSSIYVWVDKCCIPQNDDEAKATCISLIEGFVQQSKGLIVLLSWHYFSRLWCIYEWACFLRLHHPLNVEIGCDSFLRADPSETLPLYLRNIENLSVKGAQCCHFEDHKILEDKVFMYYKGKTPEESFQSFERFAKCSALSFMAKQIIQWRARNSEADEKAWLGPVRDLAERLGYQNMCAALQAAQPAEWFADCDKDNGAFTKIVEFWFESVVVRYLLKEARRAVRAQHLGAAVLHNPNKEQNRQEAPDPFAENFLASSDSKRSLSNRSKQRTNSKGKKFSTATLGSVVKTVIQTSQKLRDSISSAMSVRDSIVGGSRRNLVSRAISSNSAQPALPLGSSGSSRNVMRVPSGTPSILNSQGSLNSSTSSAFGSGSNELS